MLAKVIHFGRDDCHRLMVLRSAGYTVEDCNSLVQLRVTLEAGGAPDAMLLSDGDEVPSREVVAVARTHSTHPVVLFRTSNRAYEDSGFDLVVPCLTPPEIWLDEMDALIARKRSGLRA